MNLQKKTVSIGIALLIFIPIWLFLIVPELEKMDKDYNKFISYNRLSNINHEIGGEWEGEQIIKGESIEKTVKLDKNVQVIEGQYKAYSLDNEYLWEVKGEYGIDRSTRKIISGYGKYAENSYYYFPTKLKKQMYTIWTTQYLHPVEIKFKGVKNIQGLETYHFEAKNFVFDDSEGFEWMDMVPEVYNVLADGTINIWVEPITGIILDFKGAGVAYYANKQTDEKIQDMQIWSNEYSKDSIASQVRLAQNEKQRIILIERIIPILLALIGIALILASFIGRKSIKEEKTSKEKISKKNVGSTKSKKEVSGKYTNKEKNSKNKKPLGIKKRK